jgi:beta-lactamase superfamily II metal-dependent hydrolase
LKLTIFQSEDGDCLLLEGQAGGLVLCDGGRSRSMENVVLAELTKLHKAKKKLDAVYVSHIDQDHITGVITLLEAEAEWRVYDLHTKNKNKKKHPTIKEPKKPRPPDIENIWHNAFGDQIGKQAGAVTSLLAAAAPTLLASSSLALNAVGEDAYQIATSVGDGIKVSRFASKTFLNIPTNTLPGQQKVDLLMFDPKKPKVVANIGSMTMTVVGPLKEQMDDLKTVWEKWVDDNKGKVQSLNDELTKSINNFANSSGRVSALDIATAGGAFDGVTIPNLASLMLMAEEGNKRILLTGDSHDELIIRGLQETGYMANNNQSAIHVDVLKVQHHGAGANMSDDIFPARVSADHYIFCGNGAHDNPELDVIQRVYDSRLGPQAKRARAPQAANRPFKMWFSTQADVGDASESRRKVMREVEKLVSKLEVKSGGAMKAKFNTKPSMSFTV